ncbi:MAG: hypothetical protein IAE98_03845 [Candidatus Kapabacteria bacterium]|nr:hypothetical protein [Candidatus Kapabacteria bacterium]
MSGINEKRIYLFGGLTGVLILTIAVYLLAAFINVEWNPLEWNIVVKAVSAIGWMYGSSYIMKDYINVLKATNKKQICEVKTPKVKQ